MRCLHSRLNILTSPIKTQINQFLLQFSIFNPCILVWMRRRTLTGTLSMRSCSVTTAMTAWLATGECHHGEVGMPDMSWCPRYVLRDDHPFCIRCYENAFANNCDDCGKVIGIDSKVPLIIILVKRKYYIIFKRISPTKRSTGMKLASDAPSAALVSWISNSGAKQTGQ